MLSWAVCWFFLWWLSKFSSFFVYRLNNQLWKWKWVIDKIIMNLYSIPKGKMNKYHVPARQARTHGVKLIHLFATPWAIGRNSFFVRRLAWGGNTAQRLYINHKVSNIYICMTLQFTYLCGNEEVFEVLSWSVCWVSLWRT